MRVDILARKWGGPDGGPDGMAIAAAFLAYTLAELGHDVRGYAGGAARPTWSHRNIEWRERSPLRTPDTFDADLVISTIQPQWRHLAQEAGRQGALARTFFWHHHGELPMGNGGQLLALNRAGASLRSMIGGWESVTILPPSSWAAAAGGEVGGDAILVPGAGAAKGGYIARAVAERCSDLRWYVLPGRHAQHDLQGWLAMRHAEVAPERIPPAAFLARVRAVLSPTRAEMHPLTLVEAAVRGIPLVCTDLPATRATLGESAIYVPLDAPTHAWALALRTALDNPPPRLLLAAYADVVDHALDQIITRRAA